MQFHLENINENIIRIDEFGLGTMYIVIGQEKNVLIDTGTGVGHIKEVVDVLSQNKPYIVICTHGHVDHVGGMNQFDEVYLHLADQEIAQKVSVSARQDYARRIKESSIYPTEWTINDICDYHNMAKFIPVSDGDIFDLGDRTLQVIHVPGHTAGSICLLDKTDRVLFSGDSTQHLQLLAMPGNDRQEVLKSWLIGLDKINAYRNEFDTLLGGHEPLTLDVLDHLCDCGNKILNGELVPVHKHIHIFDDEFVSYKNIHICMSDHIS